MRAAPGRRCRRSTADEEQRRDPGRRARGEIAEAAAASRTAARPASTPRARGRRSTRGGSGAQCVRTRRNRAWLGLRLALTARSVGARAGRDAPRARHRFADVRQALVEQVGHVAIVEGVEHHASRRGGRERGAVRAAAAAGARPPIATATAPPPDRRRTARRATARRGCGPGWDRRARGTCRRAP